jgi:D-lactate dehydrogenase
MPRMRDDALLAALRAAVGARGVLAEARTTRRFRTGYRVGAGEALAVVRPRSLVELWRALEVCIRSGALVIPQAANTGLTGGSTPWGNDYPAPVVVLQMMALTGIHVLDGGRQVICLPGATLHALEHALRPYGREPHSVIGSSCIGASVIGGVCNNSGGSLLQRGPAYTELALFARVDAGGKLSLVNHLGVRLGTSPEAMLEALDARRYAPDDVLPCTDRRASDDEYRERIRAVDAATPLRFNADPRRLYEASGSAGKLVVFAVRLDTFPKARRSQVFYIGTNDPGELTALRRHALSEFRHLPVSAEYLHRRAFDVADRYGKDTFLAVRWFGTSRLPAFFRLKSWCDDRGLPSDRLLQGLSRLFPNHLPARLRAFRARFEHHLIVQAADDGIDELATHLRSTFPSATGDALVCTPDEGARAQLHRFAAAGAAIRRQRLAGAALGGLVAVDVALRACERDWVEVLPPALRDQVDAALYYGHFFCHVFHQDYLLRAGADPAQFEAALLALLDARGAEYPAEHNVGHVYRAKPSLAEFYASLDPCERLNPGIGRAHACHGAHAMPSGTTCAQ